MEKGVILIEGSTPALTYAGHHLQENGYTIASQITPDIQYVLLDVPSFHSESKLRNGKSLDTLLAALPGNVVLCGGNLSNPKLDTYQTFDLLQDAQYLAENAAITADCAVRLAMQHLTATLTDTPILIIGWGRIGKCLARMLRGLDCDVHIAARKEADRAILSAMGYPALNITEVKPEQYRLILNTAPAPVLDVSNCKYCVKIDLASAKGLIGEDVIWARGLPGMYAPMTSGKLIAKTFMRMAQEVRS